MDSGITSEPCCSMCESQNTGVPKIAATAATVHLPQICHLHGHLRKARAENTTLRNQNRLDREFFTKRESELQIQVHVHIRDREEAVKAKKELERITHDTIAATKAQVSAARRENQLAQNTTRDLKIENLLQADSSNVELNKLQKQLKMQEQQNKALRLCLASVASAVLGGPEATAESIEKDVLQALSEGSEPIERTTKHWMSLVFSLDQAAALQVAPTARGPAPPGKPHCNDGARAVLAILGGIKRLHAQLAASSVPANPHIKLGFDA